MISVESDGATMSVEVTQDDYAHVEYIWLVLRLKWKNKSFTIWLSVKPSEFLSNFKVYLCLSGSVALSVMYGVLSYQSDAFISPEKIIEFLRLLLGGEIVTSTALKAGTIFLIARDDK